LTHFGLVVIGAHIGVHIKNEVENFKKEKILLVEPVPHNVEAIKKNLIEYKDIIIEQLTVGNKKDLRDFYFVKEESVSKLKKHWASGIGSFNKDHIINHKSKRFQVKEEDIKKMSIPCIRFEDLVNKYSISSIEKLLIDVEGSEYLILKDIDLNKVNIKKIIFEYKHFDGYFKQGAKLSEINDKLEKNNYKITKLDEENILAEKF
tara:strand:- start:152 stop:766 length:615 start_codon:yes stop_codon:yes gene_type:complete